MVLLREQGFQEDEVPGQHDRLDEDHPRNVVASAAEVGCPTGDQPRETRQRPVRRITLRGWRGSGVAQRRKRGASPSEAKISYEVTCLEAVPGSSRGQAKL